MTTRQKGLTLLEMILVIGLAVVGLLISFYAKQADLEQSMARQTGEYLFEYNNAVRNYLAKNSSMAAGTRTGANWLKNTTCGGTLALGAEYLPCSFPASTSAKPLGSGHLELTTTIGVTGTAPARKLTASTLTTPFKISHAGNALVRSDLAGLAAITAAAGVSPTSAGTAFTVTSDASYLADPLDGTISMVASNSADQDIWLRTDGGNAMHATLAFDSAGATNRQITGASRIQNAAAEALYLGSPSGVAPVTGAGVIVDANAEIIGSLRVRNLLTADNGAQITGSIAATANLTAGNNVTAANNVTANKDVTAANNVSASNALVAQIFYDANNTGYYVDPNQTSNINALYAQTITTQGRLTTNEFLAIGGTATENTGCSPNGLIGKDVTGKLLTCQSGIWASSEAESPQGTVCGLSTNGGATGTTCQGYNAYVSCPAGYTQTIWKAAIGVDQKIAFCYKD